MRTINDLLYYNNETSDYEECLYVCSSTLKIFQIVVCICAFGTISTIGVVGNGLNMVIFVKQALKDSMTVELFALSLTDFAISLLELTMSTTYVVYIVFPSQSMDLNSLAFVSFGWALYTGYLISSWVTALISVERCVCVVAPFNLRQIFTRGRCPYPNGTLGQTFYYTIIFSEFSLQVETAIDITAGFFLFLTSQAVLIICSVWMSYSLKVSSLVRTYQSSSHETVVMKESLLKTQEKKLIKLVLSLAALQIVCNMPRLAVTVFYNVFQRVGVAEKDESLNLIIWTVASFSNQFCCTSNTFCYYFLNSKHKKMFRQMLCLNKDKKK